MLGEADTEGGDTGAGALLPCDCIFELLIFGGTGINITVDGRKHLGAAVGATNFKKEYVQEKIEDWKTKIEVTRWRVNVKEKGRGEFNNFD